MSVFKMKRIGLVMEPVPGNPHEVEGTLNPAAVRGHDGHLYLFTRLVARGNFSGIGIARVIFDEAGDPRTESNGLASRSNPRPTTNCAPTEAVGVRTRASLSWSRSNAS